MKWSVVQVKSVAKAIVKMRQDARLAYFEALRDLQEEGPKPKSWNVLKIGTHTYRLRLNYRYRLVYEVKEDQVLIKIIYAGHRKDAYR